MKFERLSENQVRCTLSRTEMEEMNIKVTDLAHGTEKGNVFIQDLLRSAAESCNLKVDGTTPFMIEAIPVTPDCLVLLITKVEDNDDFDDEDVDYTDEEDYYDEEPDSACKIRADEIIKCFEHLSSIIGEQLSEKILGSKQVEQQNLQNVSEEHESPSKPVPNLCKVYTFNNLEEVIVLAERLKGVYKGENTLYKDIKDTYHLVVGMNEHTVDEFNRIVNIISDYAYVETLSFAGTAYLEEHCKVIIKDEALQKLSIV